MSSKISEGIVRRVVGRNVRAIALRELSQEGLAAGMGVGQGYVSRLEAGQRNPTIVTIWHAAEVLGVRPAANLITNRRG
jgi:transcriptional regulator with XRE-family HTH domain